MLRFKFITNAEATMSESESLSNTVKNQLMDTRNWYRPITVVGVYVVLSLVGSPLVTLYLLAVLLQWGLALILGEPNAALKGLMSKVNAYVQQLMQYLAGDSDDRPFPVSLLP